MLGRHENIHANQPVPVPRDHEHPLENPFITGQGQLDAYSLEALSRHERHRLRAVAPPHARQRAVLLIAVTLAIGAIGGAFVARLTAQPGAYAVLQTPRSNQLARCPTTSAVPQAATRQHQPQPNALMASMQCYNQIGMEAAALSAARALTNEDAPTLALIAAANTERSWAKLAAARQTLHVAIATAGSPAEELTIASYALGIEDTPLASQALNAVPASARHYEWYELSGEVATQDVFPQKAQTDFALALRECPPALKASVEQETGDAFANLGLISDALLAYRAELHSVSPRSRAAPLLRIAELYQAQGHIPASIRSARLALRAAVGAANNISDRLYLAQLYVANGNKADALRILNQLVDAHGLSQQELEERQLLTDTLGLPKGQE